MYNLFASIFLHFGKFAFVNLELLLVFFYIYFVTFSDWLNWLIHFKTFKPFKLFFMLQLRR